MEWELAMNAKYWIAQYVSDVFRNEPRNVGVFVAIPGGVAGRFIGESDDKSVDGRRLRAFAYPEVYRQWLDYWREELKSGQLDSLPRSSSANFRVCEGGTVDDIGNDSADAVAAFLYSTLVSNGGLEEALQSIDTEAAQRVYLPDEITSALAQMQLLGAEGSAAPVPHPVRREHPIAGRRIVEYKPTFSQRNGALYVMEPVDFTGNRKKLSRDHAAWAALMFQDVREAAHDFEVRPVSVIKVTDEDTASEDVRNGLALLGSESSIVNWLNDGERDQFLEDRRRVAFDVA